MSARLIKMAEHGAPSPMRNQAIDAFMLIQAKAALKLHFQREGEIASGCGEALDAVAAGLN